jgi:hypothetical protein
MTQTTPHPVPDVALVTSIYGGYDQPCLPVLQDLPCRYELVTDRDPGPDERRQLAPWTIRTIERPDVDPRHAARLAKFRPDVALDPVPEIVVWIDGRVVVTSHGFVGWLVHRLGDADVAAWPHWRPNTQAEADAAASEMPRKYLAADLAAHRSWHDGEPDINLWRLTIFAMRINPRTMAMGQQVLEAMSRWPRSIDQIEFPFAARWHDVDVVPLPGDFGQFSSMFHQRPHSDGT